MVDVAEPASAHHVSVILEDPDVSSSKGLQIHLSL
jgi:hypothetical protein